MDNSVIAILGVGLSALASLIISRQNVKTELKKLSNEIQLNYAGQLLQKRLETYPKLYELISNCAKDKLAKCKMDAAYFSDLLQKVNAWDSAYAIFLSSRSGNACFRLRFVIKTLTKKNEQEIAEQIRTIDSNLMKALRELELSLKGDIGVFAVDFSPEKTYFDSYKEIADAVREEEK